MKNEIGIGTGFAEDLDRMIRRGKLAAELRRLFVLSDEQLEIVAGPIHALAEFIEGADMSEKGTEHLRWVASIYRNLISMMNAGVVSWRMFEIFNLLQQELHKAVGYMPAPFRGFQQKGAILLMAMIGHRRLAIDLSQVSLHWADNLGKPKLPDTEFTRKHPFMVPVVFCSGDGMKTVAKDPQRFYGQHPFLNHACPPEPVIASCDKWPMKNVFAFCPLPTWAADDDGEEFWFKDFTWPEQQAELLRLQREYPDMTVRFARLHELAFLDLCWRLATMQSPVEIGRFRCENPVEGKNCLTYGGVDQYGAQIEEERDSTKHERRVLPLFFIKSEEAKTT
jgi:hypothetical protein